MEKDMEQQHVYFLEYGVWWEPNVVNLNKEKFKRVVVFE